MKYFLVTTESTVNRYSIWYTLCNIL